MNPHKTKTYLNLNKIVIQRRYYLTEYIFIAAEQLANVKFIVSKYYISNSNQNE